jgi:hypothetical protein
MNVTRAAIADCRFTIHDFDAITKITIIYDTQLHQDRYQEPDEV